MKVRHTAALVLVGWYLMVTPPGYQPFGTNQAPISRWALVGGFDSADQCDQAKMEWYRIATKGEDEKGEGSPWIRFRVRRDRRSAPEAMNLRNETFEKETTVDAKGYRGELADRFRACGFGGPRGPVDDRNRKPRT
jgi:hypothetical protein